MTDDEKFEIAFRAFYGVSDDYVLTDVERRQGTRDACLRAFNAVIAVAYSRAAEIVRGHKDGTDVDKLSLERPFNSCLDVIAQAIEQEAS